MTRNNRIDPGPRVALPRRKVCAVLWSIALVFMLAVSWDRAEATPAGLLAEVNGIAISSEDLDRALGVKLIQLQEQIFKLKRSELDSQIEQRLLDQEAARRGLSIAALLDAEVTAKVALVTEAEIDAAYQANKARFVGNEAMIRERLRVPLQEQKLTAQRKAYLASLRSRATIADYLKPSSLMRLSVSIEGAPVAGPVEAPVTIVEFSDFHCPFCKRVEDTLKALLAQYGAKVKLVYRQFPIQGLHPQARRAAEASLCAHDQGKFWEYHDVLFEQSPKAADDDLKRYAKQVGLDTDGFASCLFQNRYYEQVQHDLDEGNRLGLEGTPAFFINGRFVNGAQPLEKFVQVIDEELAHATAGGQVSSRTQ